jgi:hypothetical protein
MSSKKNEPEVPDIEFATVFAHPDFDQYADVPAIAVPNFQVDRASEVIEVPTERAKSATTKEK